MVGLKKTPYNLEELLEFGTDNTIRFSDLSLDDFGLLKTRYFCANNSGILYQEESDITTVLCDYFTKTVNESYDFENKSFSEIGTDKINEFADIYIKDYDFTKEFMIDSISCAIQGIFYYPQNKKTPWVQKLNIKPDSYGFVYVAETETDLIEIIESIKNPVYFNVRGTSADIPYFSIKKIKSAPLINPVTAELETIDVFSKVNELFGPDDDSLESKVSLSELIEQANQLKETMSFNRT